ncbi:MAG: response regulator [Planctomycetota bacterium]
MARMLVVDDDPAIRDLLSAVLETWGVEARVVCSGYEATVFLSQHPQVTLLLTDLQMPGMDGLEVARRVRERHPGLRILAMTGGGLVREEAGAEFERVLRKPIDLDELQTLVQTGEAIVA